MSSQSETGHYKNVVNLKALKTFANGLGTEYTPQKETLQLPFLEALVTEMTNLHQDVKDQANTLSIAIDERQLVFQDVKPLATKIINTMSSTNVDFKLIEDAKAINAKIQGVRVNKKKQTENPDQPINNISVSRQSYDSLYENFRSLVNLLEQDNKYSPLEEEVSIVGLTAKATRLLQANEINATESNTLENLRILRNKRFYQDEDCLLNVAKDFKKYIRGKFGVNSPQFAQISGLEFKEIKPE